MRHLRNGFGLLAVLAALLALMVISVPALAAPPSTDRDGCYTIQGGTVVDSSGNPVVLGFDQYGYNYQAHLFNGTYDSSDRTLDGKYWGSTVDYADDSLIMKWSDAWIANVDCNGDHKLDRGLVDGVADGVSKGWLTNQVEGDYDSDGDGVDETHYTSFVKIVWTGPGSPLWGQYTVIEEVYNDPTGGTTGLQLKIGAPGFGLNDQWTSLP